MRKLILFFTGLLIFVGALASIVVAAAIFNSGRQIGVTTYFFQPNNLSIMRVGVPRPVSELGVKEMRQRLVEKYISEYFYAIPDTSNITSRRAPKSILARMSSSAVFNDWLRPDGEGTYIQELAQSGAMRTVRVVNDIYQPADSDWWVVEYELTTWPRSNDMATEPIVTRGFLDLGIYDKDLLEFRPDYNIEKLLDSGIDPAWLFRFVVTYIETRK